MKYVLAVIIVLSMVRCDNDPISAEEPFDLNPNGTEIKATNVNDHLITFDCEEDFSNTCGEELIKMDMCFTCDICKTDTVFANMKYVEIWLESLPLRALESLGLFQLDENLSTKVSLCIQKIPNQVNHIIAFTLGENESSTSLNFGFFNNLSLTSDKIKISREISSEDLLSAELCQVGNNVVYNLNPHSEEAKNKNVTECVIGSFGDCVGRSPISMGNPWTEDDESFTWANGSFVGFKYSIPCSGVYVHIE